MAALEGWLGQYSPIIINIRKMQAIIVISLVFRRALYMHEYCFFVSDQLLTLVSMCSCSFISFQTPVRLGIA